MKTGLFVALLAVFASFPAWAQAGKLQHQGTFFSVGAGEEVDLTVPAGVVMTDVHVTYSVPGSLANSSALFVRDDAGNVLVYESVNNTTFHAGINLQSSIRSMGRLTVTLSCYNISGNHCQGALMWSGFVA